MSVLKMFLCAAATVCCGEIAFASENYPAEWWAPVARDQAASWEVLPQDAQPGEVILSKRTALGVLSNFSLAPFELDGSYYQSLEGLWQSMKYPESETDERALFPGLTWLFKRVEVETMVAFDAKHAGDLGSQNMKTMGINWVSYRGNQMTYRTQEKGDHYHLIVRATRAKVLQNENVQSILLQTGHLILRPDHNEAPPIPPAWKYYEILMELRNELQNGVTRR